MWNQQSGVSPKTQQVGAMLNTPGIVNYPDKARIIRDVGAVFNYFGSLDPRVMNFVHNNGTQEKMFLLEGTVPIFFKGVQYNIPVRVWVTNSYPVNPPMVMVTPVAGMRIKEQHKHVDTHGTTYLPYLNQWNGNTSNLYELINILSAVFSENPPVYKAPDAAAATPPPAYQAGSSNNNINNNHNNHPPTPSVNNQQSATEQQRKQLIRDVTHNLKTCLQACNSTAANEVDELLQLKHAIEQGKEKIQSKLAITQAHIEQCKQQQAKDTQEKEQITAWLTANENSEEVNGSEAVFMKDTWSQQLLECIAHDQAVDDTLAMLDRELADDHIELVDFLKQVRNLARTQFESRALSHKIFEKQQIAHRT